MLKKKDIIIILAGAVICTAFFLLRPLFISDAVTGNVVIFKDGAEYARMNLYEDASLVIEDKDGNRNRVAIRNASVYMQDSSCKNQLCVHQGMMNGDNLTQRPLGNRIICLPNRV